MKEGFSYILITFLITGITGCVEHYYPEENDLKTGILVINAHLSDQPGHQVIEISRSLPLIYTSADPVSGAFAEVIREDGEFREFVEERPGFYECDLDDSFLQTGLSYMVHVTTPNGNEYESEFDKLRPVPGIDALYYEVERAPFSTGNIYVGGIHFFVDFTYDDEACKYLRWELTETYEFRNPALEAYIWDVDFSRYMLPDSSSPDICYITNPLKEIHSTSLANLDFGVYMKKPLIYVPNNKQKQKLKHKYSLLVKQYSMGAEAFHYWNELEKAAREQGFLFDRLPALLKSNIRNVNDEEERILGFFSMSGVCEKRAFAVKPAGLDHDLLLGYCQPVFKGPIREWGNWDEPPRYYALVLVDGVSYDVEVNKHCVDCRAYKNSTDIPPDFW